MEVLSQQGEGAFLVRESASSPGSHALSLKAPQGRIVHYMIQTSPNGVNLQVSRKVGSGAGVNKCCSRLIRYRSCCSLCMLTAIFRD